jgi:hypothetical protein
MIYTITMNGEKNQTLKNYQKKYRNYFFKMNSEEYQRMLAGFRVYFNFMTQSSFVNIMFVLFLYIFFVIAGIGIIIIKFQINFQMSTNVYFMLFYPFIFIVSFLYDTWATYDFNVKKGLIIFFRNDLTVIFLVIFL